MSTVICNKCKNIMFLPDRQPDETPRSCLKCGNEFITKLDFGIAEWNHFTAEQKAAIKSAEYEDIPYVAEVQVVEQDTSIDNTNEELKTQDEFNNISQEISSNAPESFDSIFIKTLSKQGSTELAKQLFQAHLQMSRMDTLLRRARVFNSCLLFFIVVLLAGYIL